jgi:hypothetical protein
MVTAYQTACFPKPDENKFVIEVCVLGCVEIFPLRLVIWTHNTFEVTGRETEYGVSSKRQVSEMREDTLAGQSQGMNWVAFKFDRPPSFLLYLLASSVRLLNSSQVHVMPITEATGSCTLKGSPLLQINNTTITSTVHVLFIWPKVQFCNFFRRQELI